jgi:hypothetical protein
MIMIRIIITCLILGLFGCLAESPPKKQPILDNKASFVDEFLQLEFSGIITTDTPLVIEKELSLKPFIATNIDDFAANLIKEAKQLKNKKLVEAVRDLCAKNSREGTIDEIGTLNTKHIVLTKEEKDSLFKEDLRQGWENFFQKYPKSHGFIELSWPGFSRDGTLAIIYMGRYANMIAGGGQLYVFLKKDGRWIDSGIKMSPGWMS